MRTAPLVATDWLAERLDAPGLRVVDATFFLPGQGDAASAFRKAHIPGATFFDIDAIADPFTPLPHMLPDAGIFAQAVGALGIGNEDHVIAYGAAGPRVWWTFRVMGHDAVSVLDGGLAKWIAEGRPVESGASHPAPATVTARFRPELVRDFDQVRAELAAGAAVIDARPADRFRAQAPEPRPGLRSGHMPGASSLPAAQLFTPDGTFRSDAEIAALLDAVGAGVDRPVTATCGSGVAACAIALARARLGRWDTAVYDGSWTDWASRAGAPIAEGDT